MSNDISETLRRLIDKDEIRDLMARYCRGIDRADWDLVRSTYHSDAHDDPGDYKGGINGFIAFAKSRTGGATQVMHFLSESLIEFAQRDVVWRIAHRIVVFETTRLALGEVPPLKSDWAGFSRDKSDPIWIMRADAGIGG